MGDQAIPGSGDILGREFLPHRVLASGCGPCEVCGKMAWDVAYIAARRDKVPSGPFKGAPMVRLFWYCPEHEPKRDDG